MSPRLEIDQMVRAAVAEGVAPAIAFGIARGGSRPEMWFAGREDASHDSAEHPAPPAGPGTRFDLASLTKPLTTALWILRLVEQGHLDLERPIGALLDLSAADLAAVPLWRLMNHTSGLPAHRRYFAGLGQATRRSGRFDRSRAALRRMLARTDLEAPPGKAEVYSDPGFLLLEWLAESVDGPLSARWHDLPGHGPETLHFRASREPPTAAPRYAPTERCPLRQRIIRGEVHDENAWIMGGIAGHAGLFGDLPTVLAHGRRWLNTLSGNGQPLGISQALARAAIDRRWMHPRGTRVLGWDTPTPGRSSAGTGFGRHTIGHLGFTGTSIWIDPDTQVVMVLLTNRVCPSRDNERIRRFRPRIHDAGWRWVEGCFT